MKTLKARGMGSRMTASNIESKRVSAGSLDGVILKGTGSVVFVDNVTNDTFYAQGTMLRELIPKLLAAWTEMGIK